jgi:hypothetical protein
MMPPGITDIGCNEVLADLSTAVLANDTGGVDVVPNPQ